MIRKEYAETTETVWCMIRDDEIRKLTVAYINWLFDSVEECFNAEERDVTFIIFKNGTAGLSWSIKRHDYIPDHYEQVDILEWIF